ncbi:unnamed protein product [Lupinus luteus]|uniref:chorismate mutase n=1 Tax=Lupinus luteus TaxID=3873 RepID=A0AAV1YM94_LUPLU
MPSRPCIMMRLPVVHCPKGKEKLMDMLTYPEVEEAIKRRVDMKAKTYGQEVIINMKEHKTESVYQ